MRVSCEVIKDLLPLCHDGVCSNDSKAMVEEHLAECENCKAELQAMDEIIPMRNTGQNLREAESIKQLSKKWRKGMLKSFLKGALITVAALVVLALIFYLFMDVRLT
ncbi:MAG: zf-HC2 domain-containing protein [Eubacteriaceae bacterium]|nr:zf-HC2 domain-containing protein [Eubacteriaceae bacterium]